jgi:hypothetical protein
VAKRGNAAAASNISRDRAIPPPISFFQVPN